MSVPSRWSLVAIFAVAMGYLEAAVVYYLRVLVDRLEPYQPDPLPIVGGLGPAELGRELATMIMIFTVGALAGRTWKGKFGFSLLLFGIWDISYYLFLKPLTGWPNSILDWDILFLIPLPWWGPVWAPVSIAVLMVLFGLLTTLLEQGEPPLWPGKWSGMICAAGIALALYIFMLDSIAVAGDGVEALRSLLPTHFPWKSFLFAWILMSVPVTAMTVQLLRRYRMG